MTDVYGPPRPLERAAWEAQSLCRQIDSDLWFPDRPTKYSNAAAVAFCLDCPVLLECRAAALEAREEYGVWGAMTEAEMRAFRVGNGARSVMARDPYRRLTESEVGLLLEACRKGGRTVASVAVEFGVSQRTVNTRCDRAGVERPNVKRVHGTTAMYGRGKCRCLPCRVAKAQHRKEMKKRAKNV
jgi:WhiB family redox-sensing transcriptional regulator